MSALLFYSYFVFENYYIIIPYFVVDERKMERKEIALEKFLNKKFI